MRKRISLDDCSGDFALASTTCSVRDDEQRPRVIDAVAKKCPSEVHGRLASMQNTAPTPELDGAADEAQDKGNARTMAAASEQIAAGTTHGEQDPSPCWCLVDSSTGDCFPIPVGSSYTIGRSSGCDIVVDMPGVQAEHCKVIASDGKRRRLRGKTSFLEWPAVWSATPLLSDAQAVPTSSTGASLSGTISILDLSSSTGTFVNNQKLPPGSRKGLVAGDAISLAASDGPSHELKISTALRQSGDADTGEASRADATPTRSLEEVARERWEQMLARREAAAECQPHQVQHKVRRVEPTPAALGPALLAGVAAACCT